MAPTSTRTDEDFTDFEKAVAMLRLEAMKGDLTRVHSSASNSFVWRLSVRGPDTGRNFVHDNEAIESAVAWAHKDWVPEYVAHRKGLVQRAAKFNVTEISETEIEFTGINNAPEGSLVVFSHLYDSLEGMKDERPSLVYNRMTPAEWQFATPQISIRAPTLTKFCHRLNAHLHQHFITQRAEILEAAKQAGLFEEPESVAEAELPVVVAPHVTELPKAPEPEPEALTKRPLLFAGVILFALGTLVGYLLASW